MSAAADVDDARIAATELPGAAVKALLLVLAACSHVVKPSSNVWPIAVVSWPKPIQPECRILDMRPAPSLPAVSPPADELGVGRVYVRASDIHELMDWLKEVEVWIGETNRCMRKLTGPP